MVGTPPLAFTLGLEHHLHLLQDWSTPTMLEQYTITNQIIVYWLMISKCRWCSKLVTAKCKVYSKPTSDASGVLTLKQMQTPT